MFYSTSQGRGGVRCLRTAAQVAVAVVAVVVVVVVAELGWWV